MNWPLFAGQCLLLVFQVGVLLWLVVVGVAQEQRLKEFRRAQTENPDSD